MALARRLHTLKGNARSLGLAALAHMIHEMEDALPASDGQAQRLGKALRELLEFHHEVLVRPELKSTLADFVRQTVQDAAQKVALQLGKVGHDLNFWWMRFVILLLCGAFSLKFFRCL